MSTNKVSKHALIVICFLLVFILFTGNANALMLELSLDELTEGADSIIIGTVEETSSQWNAERTSIYTSVIIVVEEVIDEVELQSDKITVVIPGGEVEGIKQVFSDMPVFTQGEKVFLFLDDFSDGNILLPDIASVQFATPAFTVFGLFQGKLDVIDEKIDSQNLPAFVNQIRRIIDEDSNSLDQTAVDENTITVRRSPYVYNGQRWPEDWPNVGYSVNSSGGPAGSLTAIQNAAASWSNAGAKFSYSYTGTHSRTGLEAFNGANEILWGNLGAGSTLALATWWINTATGDIIEADIVFNTYHDWSTTGGDYDVETVVLHEFGHWLSLGHSDIYGAIMWATYKGIQRTLHADDIAGIKHIYGSSNGTPGINDLFGIALYDQQGGQFYVKDDTTPGPADRTFRYGPRNNKWFPVAGDWNGDGTYGVALYDQQGGQFYVKDNTTPGPADRSFRYGPRNNNWLPVAGDWNGNGIYGVALYDQQGGQFYVKDNTTPGPADRSFRYGPRNNNWLPVAGDWNGNGIYGVALYDQKGGQFYVKDNTTPGPADRTFRYGPRNNNWWPAAGDWNGNGVHGVTLYDQQGGQFYVKDNTTPGPADRTFRYGPRNNNWLPTAGNWGELEDEDFVIKDGAWYGIDITNVPEQGYVDLFVKDNIITSDGSTLPDGVCLEVWFIYDLDPLDGWIFTFTGDIEISPDGEFILSGIINGDTVVVIGKFEQTNEPGLPDQIVSGLAYHEEPGRDMLYEWLGFHESDLSLSYQGIEVDGHDFDLSVLEQRTLFDNNLKVEVRPIE